MFSMIATTPVLLDQLGTIEIEDHHFGPKPYKLEPKRQYGNNGNDETHE